MCKHLTVITEAISRNILKKSKMAENGTWAMDVEIMAMGTILQTPITVSTEFLCGMTWLSLLSQTRMSNSTPVRNRLIPAGVQMTGASRTRAWLSNSQGHIKAVK